MITVRPLAYTRGPGTSPRRTAAATLIAMSWVLPRSRTVVTPPLQLCAGVRDRLDSLLLFGLVPEGRDRITASVPHQVNVKVHEPGSEDVDVSFGGRGSRLVVVHPLDLVLPDSKPRRLPTAVLGVPQITVQKQVVLAHGDAPESKIG
jgi:hypothetical protein